MKCFKCTIFFFCWRGVKIGGNDKWLNYNTQSKLPSLIFIILHDLDLDMIPEPRSLQVSFTEMLQRLLLKVQNFACLHSWTYNISLRKPLIFNFSHNAIEDVNTSKKLMILTFSCKKPSKMDFSVPMVMLA